MPKPATNRLETPVQFADGLGRTQRGATLSFDGTSLVTLTREDGTVRFSTPISSLGKVRRAEFALYFKVDGKMVTAMFGNPLKYIGKNVGIEAAGRAGGTVTSVAAGYGAVKASQKDNTASGLEAWVALLQEHGVMGLNASPQALWNKMWKWTGIVVGVLLVVGVVVALG